MFKLEPKPTFAARVRLTVPGQERPAELGLTFRHRGKDAITGILSDAEGRYDDLLPDLVASWEGVTDADGNEIAFSRSALLQLLDAYPAAGREIFSQYLEALTASRLGN